MFSTKAEEKRQASTVGRKMFEWKDKVCIITGACSGIGWSFVQSVLKKGAKCLMADLNFKAGEQKEKELQDEYGQDKVIYFRVDVSSAQNFEAAFEKCLEFFGKVDVLINSAGIVGESNWETLLQINLMGSIRGCKLAMKYMGKNGYGGLCSTNTGGVVMNISSICGLHKHFTFPTYCASKSGIIAYTRSAGNTLEYAQHGVKMICFCPSAVETPLHDTIKHCGATELALQHQQMSASQYSPFLKSNEVSEAGIEIIQSGETASVWTMHLSGTQAFLVPDPFENLEDLLKLQN